VKKEVVELEKVDEKETERMSSGSVMSPSMKKIINDQHCISEDRSFFSKTRKIKEEQQIEMATRILQAVADIMHANGWTVANVFDLDQLISYLPGTKIKVI
jgi:hemerythrin superfamily protein